MYQIFPRVDTQFSKTKAKIGPNSLQTIVRLGAAAPIAQIGYLAIAQISHPKIFSGLIFLLKLSQPRPIL